MSSAIIAFDNVQKGFLPVVAAPCLLLCFILYRFAKHRLHDPNRIYVLFGIVNATIFGRLIFHILPHIGQPYLLGIGVTFFVFYLLFSDIDIASVEVAIDNTEMQVKPLIVEDNLTSEDTADNYFLTRSNFGELKRRRRIVSIFYVAMIALAVFEGLYLPHRGRGTTLALVMFWISKLLQTVAVATAMIHACFHAMEETRYNWYLILSVFWCITCGVSTIPAMVDYTAIVEYNIPVSIFYALTAGILLWMTFYFLLTAKFANPNSKTVVVRNMLFGLVLMWNWVSSFLMQ